MRAGFRAAFGAAFGAAFRAVFRNRLLATALRPFGAARFLAGLADRRRAAFRARLGAALRATRFAEVFLRPIARAALRLAIALSFRHLDSLPISDLSS